MKDWLRHLCHLVPEIIGKTSNICAIQGLQTCLQHLSMVYIRSALDIAGTFASKVSDYLNTHDPTPRDVLMSSLTSGIGTEDVASLFVSVECLYSAFSKLKLSKADGSILVSGHLIMCLPAVVEPISQLFNAMLRHSFMPKLLRDCILVPIPKSAKDPSSSDSYHWHLL